MKKLIFLLIFCFLLIYSLYLSTLKPKLIAKELKIQIKDSLVKEGFSFKEQLNVKDTFYIPKSLLDSMHLAKKTKSDVQVIKLK